MIKRINAVVSWVLILAMLGHLAVMDYSMCAGIYNPVLAGVAGKIAMTASLIHIAISLIIMFLFHDGSSLGKYRRLNAGTLIQRVAALVMILLVHAHGKGYSVVPEIIFTLAVLVHTAVSVKNSFITLGIIRTERAERAIELTAWIGCAVLAVISIVALLLFTSLVGGAAE